jgi:hypothetical protein
MTGVEVLEQRTVGKQRGCDVRVGRATGIGQQAAVTRLGRHLSVEAQPIDEAQRAQGALRAVLDQQPDHQIRRQAPRPDHLSVRISLGRGVDARSTI